MPIDAENLGKLLDRYWAVLVAWVGSSREGTDDVVQSAFIKLSMEDPAPSNCAAWLFTVTKRLAINESLSRSKRRSRESLVASQKTEIDGSGGDSNEFELLDLLNTLSSHEREVVIARIWGGLSFDQIASVFGEPKATVWRVYQSGINRLRESYKGCLSE
jgi:RNA polymerase sigma factor (sigma-70 family)